MTEGEMQDVVCRRCGTTVLVAKNSPVQTSIQWLSDAGASCAELAEHRAAGELTALVASCQSLRLSIDEAVREGRLRVAP